MSLILPFRFVQLRSLHVFLLERSWSFIPLLFEPCFTVRSSRPGLNATPLSNPMSPVTIWRL